MARDFIPTSWAAFAIWLANFNEMLPDLAEKYGIALTVVAQTNTDNSWLQYWVKAKESAKQQEKQLTDYMNLVADGDLGAPLGTIPTWSLPPNMPTALATGIKKRIREIAAGIKAQKSIYTQADGELLGIVSPEEAGKPAADYLPTFKISPMNNYHLAFEFRREGLDAVRFEVRHKGGDWQHLGDSAISPTDFLVTPLTPGAAEQIEIRAIFLKNYKPFGSYSPVYPTTVAP